MKTDQELKTAGFTESGAKRYVASANTYCDDLLQKSTALGERDKAADSPLEITHEHVRGATLSLQMRSRDTADNTAAFLQVGEYICTALAGVGGGKLETNWGTPLFVVSIAVGVILFIIRSNRGRNQ